MNLKKTSVLLLFCASLSSCVAQAWETLVADFAEQYQELDIEPLHIGYIDNLEGIQDAEGQRRQKAVFSSFKAQLENFERSELKAQQQLEYDLLSYYIQLNEDRLQIEERWESYRKELLLAAGLAKEPMGKEWYTYYLKAWLDRSVHPDSLFKFGLRESDRVARSMKAIQEASELDGAAFQAYLQSPVFLEEAAEDVEAAIAEYESFVSPKLLALFPDFEQTPPVYVRRGTDSRLAQVPAFYRDATFFYNLFEEPFNLRQVAFLYLHEANPGHHYELSRRDARELPVLTSLFYHPGYSEGWAAYIEDLALDTELYRNEYDEYGKWEWDLIRSVRVALDVALNYYGWSDEQALTLWRKYLPGQNDIAHREIARMKRWPAQVISYKYGSQKILEWKERWMNEERGDLLAFHEAVLQHGQVPFSVLESSIFNPTK